MFLQPDWFEVTKPGVGTNRFAYGLGDPVNLSDPEGNYATSPEVAKEKEREGASRKEKNHDLDIAQTTSTRSTRVGSSSAPDQGLRTALVRDLYRQIDTIRAENGMPPMARMTNPVGSETVQQLRNARRELDAVRLEINVSKGRIAEEQYQRVHGQTVIGQQITVETSTGRYTRIDFVRNLNTQRIVEEVKSSTTARQSRGQIDLMNDIAAGRPVTPRGASATSQGFPSGVPVTFDGYAISVPSTWMGAP